MRGGPQVAREGAQLIGGLHLGKALGQGFQVRFVLHTHKVSAICKQKELNKLTCLPPWCRASFSSLWIPTGGVRPSVSVLDDVFAHHYVI